VAVAVLACLGATAGRAVLAGGGDREEKVRKDRERVEAQGFWIYDDLARGLAAARDSGKPLVVALRCIPCENCVKLDDDLVDTDPRLRPLLEQFVRVRLVGTNGLDLATFQFDTDQSFAVFLLRADGTIYGRYGTRSHHTAWADDVSIEGLAAALEGALALHAAWPRDQAALAAKRGPPPRYASPEKYPTLAGRYKSTLPTEGEIVPSCIHCHQIGEAEHAERLAKGAIPDEALFPFPHPKAVGLVLDPRRRAVVKRVEAGSAAAAAGFLPGDEVLTMAGQPLLSIADVQWVLDRVPAGGGTVEARLSRSGRPTTVTLALPEGWRRADDVAWRASTWQLRRVALGGLLLEAVPEDDPALKDVPADRRGGVRLRVGHVGQYAPHDRAKRAGFRKGDLLLAFDGRTDLARDTDVLRYALDPARRARTLDVDVQRGAQTLTLHLPPE
jgi:hypothetical protein